MKCKNCGTVAIPGDRFCMNCGAAIDFSDNNSVNNSDNNSVNNSVNNSGNKKQTNMTAVIIAVAAVAVVLIVAIAVVICFVVGKNSSSETAVATSQTTTVAETEKTTSSEQTTYNLVSDIETTTVPTTAQTTTEKQTVPQFSYDDYRDQFLFDSANKYITNAYLSGCTRDEITVILNEIYARHGYIFKDAELRAYFNSQSWYYGTTSSLDEAASYFNSIERKNVDTIYKYMKAMGWRD